MLFHIDFISWEWKLCYPVNLELSHLGLIFFSSLDRICLLECNQCCRSLILLVDVGILPEDALVEIIATTNLNQNFGLGIDFLI